MTKLFLIVIGIITLVAVGAFAAVVNPLMDGVTQNLGGPPRSPFHSPVPQSFVDAVLSPIQHASLTTWLIVACAVGVLMLLHSLNSLLGQRLNVAKEEQARDAELRRRARMAMARQRQQSEGTSGAVASTPDLKSLLK
jgi:hypothetical protein